MARSTVHVGMAWRIVLRDLGLDERTVLRRAGLATNTFAGEGTLLSIDQYFALHRAVEAESGDPNLALMAGQVVSVELFDPAIFAALCSPNLNIAATRLGTFKRLVGAFRFDIDVSPQGTHIHYGCKYRPDIPISRGLSELVFLVAFARRATRHHVVPERVTVRELPSDPSAYTKYLGRPLELGTGYDITFHPRDGLRPFLTHNDHAWKGFEPMLRQRMEAAAAAQSVAEQVRAVLYELLPSGRTQMSDAARELGMSTRTLQRRLAMENTTWLNVLNATRADLAQHYLRNTSMAPAEVSFLLGFDDPNSLFRAFQRWTGMTPTRFREEDSKEKVG